MKEAKNIPARAKLIAFSMPFGSRVPAVLARDELEKPFGGEYFAENHPDSP